MKDPTMDKDTLETVCDPGEIKNLIKAPTDEDTFPSHISFEVPTSDGNMHILTLQFEELDTVDCERTQDCYAILRSHIDECALSEEDVFLVCDIPEDGSLANFLYGTTPLRLFYERHADWIIKETWEGQVSYEKVTPEDLQNPSYDIPEHDSDTVCIMASQDAVNLLEIRKAAIRYIHKQKILPLVELQKEFRNNPEALAQSYAEKLEIYLDVEFNIKV